MKIIFRLKTILVMSVAISTVLLVATVFFIVPNTNAQTDIDACQNEYNASRSKCIEDNKICNASCGENYDCKLACNLEANSCEDATVDRQRKCLGVWPYDQSSDQDLPVVDVSPTQPESPPQTTIPPPAQPQTSPKTLPPTTPQHTTTKPPEQPAEQSTEQAPQTIVDWTNKIDNFFITLSAGFEPIFVTFLDKITENKPEDFLNKQPDEQQKIIDDFIKSERPATVIVGKIDGKPIEVELRDMPLADTAKEPLKVVARQDPKGILEISPSLWLNSEETLIRGATLYPVPGGEQEKYLLSEEYRQKGHFSLPIVDPIGLSFEEYHKKRGEMLSLFESQFNYTVPIVVTASGQSVSLILLGGDSPTPKTTSTDENQKKQQTVNWENIKFVTKPGARQIGVLNDTPFVLHPDSQVSIKSLNALELSGGAVEIQRPNDPLDSSFVVETPLGTVKSNKTRFWVAYNPTRGYILVGVWEGAVSVTHAYTGKTMMLEAFENGTPNIVLLLSPEFGKSKIGTWLWIILVIAIVAVGYFAYLKKDMLMRMIKKQPTP
ncbi:MAG: hypothetical protein A3G60_01870 [Candidatus Ryanbacteria bacterium RIFCSPLOWO2_12_FULL_47_9c]|uniref:FecR protein domain-containing protein n=2 Tax=Candidatus Ryaniibacteriota TaxID=1817914 RepID=A0A1G2H178_9BACT|nr:MAG: hypothetical protein UX74_C0005G0018 [Parcubacteria group bacterium GW2011_GWA2_47_10b]OGZ44815.1 MAG: hypothetical protein A2844_01290 [Candidatus Ryanbacteria bacterium RIFCSPHIGHO2_01_FULL_48_80]OGZ49321.1 MAG: hypothetical protein A3C83_01875 [Candidatus Ryanbacteria bacterium RIFCSPHIGHO2_02_FULL_47_25]OGZ56236.1 MAG: hypothetical protein A3G60_01870 [Candidatus Ryanbacteria bacterium RIFCSPLOWO2_12_FULL_47_9c]OGZ56600.1 MAG: hypothetical protein A3J04_01990 [Candidatus Ryanbacteri